MANFLLIGNVPDEILRNEWHLRWHGHRVAVLSEEKGLLEIIRQKGLPDAVVITGKGSDNFHPFDLVAEVVYRCPKVKVFSSVKCAAVKRHGYTLGITSFNGDRIASLLEAVETLQEEQYIL